MIALAAPAVIFAAIFALLFLLAWQQWGQAVSNTLNVNLPVVGRVLGGLIIDALNAAYFAAVFILDGVVAPIGEFILRPIAAVENNIAAAYSSAVNSYLAIYGIINTRIPWAISTAYNNATSLAITINNATNVRLAGLANDLISLGTYVQLEIAVAQNAAESAALAWVNGLRTDVSVWVNTLTGAIIDNAAIAKAFTLSAYTESLASTQRAYDQATGYATDLAAVEEQHLAAAVTQLEAYATTTTSNAIGALVTDIDNGITTSLAGIITDIGVAIPELEGIIGTGDAAILDALKRIDWSIPGTITGVTSLAGVTALTLTRYLRDCGIPNCQNLSQLGNDLQAILGIVEDASFLEFLVELIHNPSGAAGIVQDTFGSQISAGLDAAKSLLGV